MLRTSRLTLLALIISLFVYNSFCFAESSLWQYATTKKPAGEVSNVFSFHTTAAGNFISLSYAFYDTENSGSCSGALGQTITYTPCIDATHADKTYYISKANLFKIASLATDEDITKIRCSKEEDNPGGAVAERQATCDINNELCSSTANTTGAVNLSIDSACS
jgi:hypothetical protein